MVDLRATARDELLVLSCLEGNSDAFRALVKRWQEPLWQYAYRLTRGDADASDVMQDAWIHIARGIGKLREPSSFRRWAYTIVTRRAADWAAKRSRDGMVAHLEEVPSPAAVDSEPNSAIEALREALDLLPHDSRLLLSLRYVNEFGLHDIAGILGIPEGTAKSRLHKARANLRDMIERNHK